MRARAVVAALALAGCYAPDAASGSYLCGSGDSGSDTCPLGLECTCGQCVKHASDAACSFVITADQAVPPSNKKTEPMLEVDEHAPFSITIQALDQSGQPATAFDGAVGLSATWGDVRVCKSSSSCPSSDAPPTVKLSGGVAHGQYISLDRETISPQSAILRASFASAVGTSGDLRITVDAPLFARDKQPLVAPVTGAASAWGWADVAVGAPYVVPSEGKYEMFVLGFLSSGVKTLSALGLATSSDGRSFTLAPAPIVQATDDTAAATIGQPGAIVDAAGVHLYYSQSTSAVGAAQLGFTADTAIESQTASAFGTPFGAVSTALDLTATPSDCPYCLGLNAPALLADPTPALNGGAPNAKILYFSTVQQNQAGSVPAYSLSIVRAYAADGVDFAVDPSPLIKSNSDEEVIYSARVIVDGTVYKMWYSYATSADVVISPSPCAMPAVYRVGYATSSDGYFWVRSLHNMGAAQPGPNATEVPVMAVATSGWDANESVLVGSVAPTDGVDPANGISLYYSPFVGAPTKCVPDGIGLATRR